MTDKLYRVSFDEGEAIVRVRIVGKATHEDHCAAQDDAVQFCLGKNCQKLLVDLRELSTELSSTSSCILFAEPLAKRPVQLRIANVLPVDSKSAEDVRFVSTITSIRDHSTRVFSDMEEARQWLLQKPSC